MENQLLVIRELGFVMDSLQRQRDGKISYRKLINTLQSDSRGLKTQQGRDFASGTLKLIKSHLKESLPEVYRVATA